MEVRLQDRRITLDADSAAREWLAKTGYSEEFGIVLLPFTFHSVLSVDSGARAISRIVQSAVLTPLAKRLLIGTIRLVPHNQFVCGVSPVLQLGTAMSSQSVFHKMVLL